MPLPAFGLPGHAFVGARLLQVTALVTLIGLLSHCIHEFHASKDSTSAALVSSLAICCFALVYAVFTTALYWKSALPLFLAAAADATALGAFVVISVLLGQSVVPLTCKLDTVPSSSKTQPRPHSGMELPQIWKRANTNSKDANGWAPLNVPNLARPEGAKNIMSDGGAYPTAWARWLARHVSGCRMAKGTWAVVVLVAATFLISAIACAVVWWQLRRQARQEARAEKDVGVDDDVVSVEV